jgi:hypothetical protein
MLPGQQPGGFAIVPVGRLTTGTYIAMGNSGGKQLRTMFTVLSNRFTGGR